jgi:Protein of unknown function (DUF1376)
MTAPEPLVPADVDLRDLDGFMLNVERLLASELWAIATGTQIKAALSLWCRAWKQVPAASLPDDERVLAPFAGLPLAQFRRERAVAMRGFVKCADGRLYHRVLAQDALRAWQSKCRRADEKQAEAERIKRWREQRRGNGGGNGGDTGNATGNATRTGDSATPNATRTYGVRQDRDSTGQGQGQGQGQGLSVLQKALTPLASSPDGLSAGGTGEKRVNGHGHTQLEIVERIPVVGGGEYAVTQTMVAEFERAYPSVDIPQTLREMRVWCIANPKQCKTEKGVLRFVNSWLVREQNRG